MSLTRTEAVDSILSLFKAAWDTTGYEAKYDNVACKSAPPDTQEPWARVVLRHTTSRQASLAGESGNRRFRRTGVLTIQVFEIAGNGLTGLENTAIIVRDTFEGVTSPEGVIFRDVTINEVGPDGDFFQTNVVVSFEYDEIK